MNRQNILPFRPHDCSVPFCDPLNDIGLVKRGYNAFQNTPESLYICKYGQIHDCAKESCGISEICPVSGASKEYIQEYNDYNKHDSRTWKLPSNLLSDTRAEKIVKKYVGGGEGGRVLSAAPKALLRKKKYSDTDVQSRIGHIVETILYSPKRKLINDELWSGHTKRVKREKDNYINECGENKVPVNLIKLLMIESSCDTSKLHFLNILKRDQNVIDRYVSMILQIYKFAELYIDDNKVSPEAISLGILYKMQQGMIVEDVTLIPIEEFLIANLPLMNDLGKLGIDKKKYTTGERLIFLMYENAKKKGKTMHELIIIEGLITEQKFNELGTVVHCESDE